MPSFALSEVGGEFKVKVLDGLSVHDNIFDELKPAIESGTGTVVMDFAGTSYVNAVFLSTLKKLQKSLDSQHRRLVLTSLSETMEEILRVTDMSVETQV